MTITNRTRFAFWQWDQRNRAWMQTNGPGSRRDMETWLKQRTEGARAHGMWGSAYCVLPVKEGAPLYAPNQLVALDIDGMSLEIITEGEATDVDPQSAAVDTAPQPQPQPQDLVPAPSVTNTVRDLLAGMERLRNEIPGTAYGSEAGSDFAIELAAAMRHLRNVGRVLREGVDS